MKLKLWLLDADIIIDFLTMGVFDNLVQHHEVYVASTVIMEVRFYKCNGITTPINFREKYVDSDLVREVVTSAETMERIFSAVPKLKRESLHIGEIESLTILKEKFDETGMKFCTCDAAAIRVMPFLSISTGGISAEELLRTVGLLNPKLLENKHKKSYFLNNLEIGSKEKIETTPF